MKNFFEKWKYILIIIVFCLLAGTVYVNYSGNNVEYVVDSYQQVSKEEKNPENTVEGDKNNPDEKADNVPETQTVKNDTQNAESNSDLNIVKEVEEQSEPKAQNSESEEEITENAVQTNNSANQSEKEDFEEEKNICSLYISCETALEKKDQVSQDIASFLPEDGVIFSASDINFEEGESVFDVLDRELKDEGIHFEFESTPIYNSMYIEGIGNIYEFDFGEGSGWMYKVNGEFPQYGCSRYILSSGDVIEFVYTCNFGEDVGGNNGF